MSSDGDQDLPDIQLDIACPSCAYSLLGLRGAVVRCPECGLLIDRAKLVVERWSIPWYSAPGLTRIELAGIWLAVGAITCFYLILTQGSHSLDLNLTMGGPWLLGWILLFRRSLDGFGGWTAWRLVVLGQLVAVGLVVGFGGVVIGMMMVTIMLVSGDLLDAGLAAVATVVFGVVAYLSRHAERLAVEQCIRHHLRRAAARPV